MTELLTLDEVAERLRVSRRTVERLVEAYHKARNGCSCGGTP